MKAIITLIALLATADASLATKTITVAEISNGAQIIGTLGLPMGQICRITCAGFQHQSPAPMSTEGKTFVKVLTANDRQLSQPVVIEFTSFSWAPVVCPKPNETVTVIGYEDGGFSGIPPNAFEYISTAQSDGYYFRTCFTALKRIGLSEPAGGAYVSPAAGDPSAHP